MPAMKEHQNAIRSFPKCVLKIEPGDHTRQMELLRGNHLDLALMLEPAPAGCRDGVTGALGPSILRTLTPLSSR